MPTVLRIGALRFYFYSHEPNEPPQIHVDRGEATMKVWPNTIEFAKNRGFRAHEIGAIVALVEANRALLSEAWDEHFR